MEALIGLFALGFALVLLAMPVVALFALTRANQALREVQEMRARLEALGGRVLAVAQVPPLPPAAPVPPATPVAPARPSPSARAPASPAAPRSSAVVTPDFATNLGPRILVWAGGLAVVFFLAFFVRYAWENDWVGPTGWILSGAVFSLGLVAGGLRIMGREYRPLGQGLAAAGFAGLYITAFAAHAVYGLLPRPGAAAFMVAVTTCAVLVAERLTRACSRASPGSAATWRRCSSRPAWTGR
jgi:uncharacterized membrane protein